jgi:hypothetical protein
MNKRDREAASRPPRLLNTDTTAMRNLFSGAATFLGLATAALTAPTAAFAQHIHGYGYYYP